MATSARIDELRKKFEENPRRYFAPLANEYRKGGDPERAVAICEEYLPQQPGHMSGHIVYGQALYELGRYDEARQVFETALSLDPENLIALRHLGDIARMAGDAHAARVWYQRVLEADPRNEEIAQLMMSLLSTPVGSEVVDHNAPTPLSSPAVPPRAATPTPMAAVEPPASDPRLDTTAEMEAPRPVTSPYTPFPPPAVAPQNFVSRHAPKEEELLDLDSFDLGGVPLSSLRNAKTAESEPEASTPPSASSTSDTEAAFEEFDAHAASAHHDEQFVEEPYLEPEPDEDLLAEGQFVEESFVPAPFVEQSLAATPAAPLDVQTHASSPEEHEDVGIEKAQEFAEGFEPDVFAIAAKPLTEDEVGAFEEEPPGTIELATDIGLGLPDDGGSSSTFIASEEAPVDGLESFEAGFVSGHSAADPSTHALETESFFDTPVDAESSSPDALVDGFIEDEGAVTGMSAFSQVRDETTDSVDEPETAAMEVSSHATPAFPESAEPELGSSEFHEAEPASLQGDPFLAAAFGDSAVHAESSTEHGVESTDVQAEPEQIATADSVEADAHVPAAEESSAVHPGAFTTETMAALYLEQGHFDKAIDIYRQLVQQRPDDISLRDRLHAAEERAWGHQRDLGESILDESDADADFSHVESDATPQPRTYGGPTIREFLTGIFYPRVPEPVEEPAVVADEGMHAEPELHETHEDVAAMAELPPDGETSSARGNVAASPSDSVSNSLGALFAEADAAMHSDHMATPMGGTPAHRAPTELSLDHVFKSNPAAAPSKDAFSFDQFFSEGATEPSTPAAEPVNEAPANSNDDIAQFNKWLNGLKKS